MLNWISTMKTWQYSTKHYVTAVFVKFIQCRSVRIGEYDNLIKLLSGDSAISDDGDMIAYLAFVPCLLMLISVKIIMEELDCCGYFCMLVRLDPYFIIQYARTTNRLIVMARCVKRVNQNRPVLSCWIGSVIQLKRVRMFKFNIFIPWHHVLC